MRLIAGVAVMLGLSVGLGACSGSHDERWGTYLQIRRMSASVERFRETQGRLPDTLEEICERKVDPCLLQLPHRWTADRWGGRIAITSQDEGHYEIRSPGQDGLLNTADDVVLSSRAEKRRVARFSGCYSTNMGQWRQTALDTIVLSGTPAGSGEYELAPTVTGYRGSWAPFSDDSLFAVWSDGLSGFGILAYADGASLRGESRRFSDIGGPGSGGERFQAHRIPCDATAYGIR